MFVVYFMEMFICGLDVVFGEGKCVVGRGHNHSGFKCLPSQVGLANGIGTCVWIW